MLFEIYKKNWDLRWECWIQVENKDEMFPRFLNSSSVEKEIQR